MQDILKLYLTRMATLALLRASSQVVGFFPLGLRQGSALTLFSVVFVLMNLTPLRAVFALLPMSGYEALAVAAALAIWLFTVRFVWRHRLMVRLVGAVR